MSAEAAVKEYPQEIKDLGDSIARLTLMQANDLVGYLKAAYQIEPAAGGAVVMAAAVGPQASSAPEEPTEFNVILKDSGAQKIPVIKIVREVTSLGLKEAKALVDSAPAPVKEGLSKDDAAALKAKLEEAGATVELKPVG